MRPMEHAVLAALAVRHPSAVSTDSLIDALWPSDVPPSARKTLQNNVLRIRRQLGAAAIETVDDGYRLGAGVETDLARFEAAARAVDRHAGPSEWDAIVAWCPDEVLTILVHWAPAAGRRAELEELRSSAVESRWEAALSEGSSVDAVPELEALVAAAPLRERRWRLLMAAYQRSGRRAEGLRAFERARRTLAVEIGLSPGPELVDAYEALLRDVPVPVGTALATTNTSPDLLAQSDERREAAIAALARGDARDALSSFADAAHLARSAGDVRRFAEAALAASGEGWRTAFDATFEAVALIDAALERVPPAPTPLRSRLLSRSAVIHSHHVPMADGETQALRALAIARAVDDPGAVASALHALTVVVWDPARRQEHREWLDEVIDLARLHPNEPWRRWVAPVHARALVREGDLESACEVLDALAEEATTRRDAGAAYAASHVGLLRASVAGDWPGAATAVKTVCADADAAAFDPAGTAMQRGGLLGVIRLLSGPDDVGPLTPIEWPLSSMALSAAGWHADCQARAGMLEAATASLARIDPAMISEVDRDGYWLPTLSTLADAAHLTGFVPIAEAVAECLDGLTDLAVADPGLLYRGAVAHFAGLAAATRGRRDEALDLLTQGFEMHERHGSPWMAMRSSEAIAALPV